MWKNSLKMTKQTTLSDVCSSSPWGWSKNRAFSVSVWPFRAFLFYTATVKPKNLPQPGFNQAQTVTEMSDCFWEGTKTYEFQWNSLEIWPSKPLFYCLPSLIAQYFFIIYHYFAIPDTWFFDNEADSVWTDPLTGCFSLCELENLQYFAKTDICPV